ncbi:hypothetical protein B0A48_03865 [Cryoendolithus antarcticus]|uniref:Uncharacterized protein n=1 Tax=Cryoendolithus antarcticus TaxID=1507870 RepID=A0A1V8TGQ3_9PEZI|nr:hypothetical protein B0A48_03865 [Cryoendolithus antarcticus]
MNHLRTRALTLAEREKRFQTQPSELHQIVTFKDGAASHKQVSVDLSGSPELHIPTTSTSPDQRIPDSNEISSRLRCVFQRKRPAHIRGRADCLPFQGVRETEHLFDSLKLPSTYFQISDGLAGSAQAQIHYGSSAVPSSFDLITHCVSKQGDWAIALSHSAITHETTAFWSVDSRFDADELIEDLAAFKHCAAHPLLVPCIMFAANLRMSEKRRQSIKERLHRLEHSISELARVDALSDTKDLTHTREDADSQRLETLYEVLHSCRKDQASREGRYGFWRECNGALDEGFKYVDLLMLQAPTVPLRVAHDELLQWKNVAYHKLESLMARDKDHVNRVNTVSDLLSSLVQQRDMRLQASIARASQRDSEEMRFIAVLGSIFLPASLIATILNVPEFQFASGPVLFGAYLAITAPLIVVVMVLCFFRTRVYHLLSRRRRPLNTSSAVDGSSVNKPVQGNGTRA